MIQDRVNNDYFEWLFDMMCEDRYSEKISYRKLLMFLHNKKFRYSISRDENRAEDGMSLRIRFDRSYDTIENAECYIEGPCSVLEMIVALAIRCEEDIMDDPSVGDRTRQWFWGMIVNLGLGSMSDDNFDKRRVDDVVECFLNREYEPDGKGGLFTIRDCDCDLRDVEIWYQMCWYINSIL